MSAISHLRLIACPLALFATAAFGQNSGTIGQRHVLLISIDGMHAVDFLNCAESGACPALTALAENGVNYSRTTTSQPSDSFPGLMTLMTGGTPKTIGVWYDDAYDRGLAPPAATTGDGLLAGSCTPNQPNGTSTEYDEGIDYNQNLLTGGGPAYTNPIDGGYLSIEAARLVRDPYAGCAPVYPWNFIRTNTIFGVIHAAGGYTAWSDKHPSYSSVSGPTGSSTPSNVDDYYSPEINSNIIGLPGMTTVTGQSCSSPSGTGAWTTDFTAIKCYDQLKVNAIVNEINGKNHLGTKSEPVPVLFGMNFQAVSVGQKLIENGTHGGYMNAAGTPTPSLAGEIQFVDAAIGQMVTALKKQGLFNSTTIIITAKHGQSPIDPNRFLPIPGPAGSNGMPPSAVLGSAYLPASYLNQLGPTEDDISLLWLLPGASVQNAVNLLESNGTAIGLGQIFYGPTVEVTYDRPGPPSAGDTRTPDIIVAPNYGVVYTGSSAKLSEHGGFSHDDTNVMLLVSDPRLAVNSITSFVQTAQVAPTILSILGLNPRSLTAVQQEGTPVLPGLSIAPVAP